MDPLQRSKLTARFNQYLQYREEVKKTKEEKGTFAERLDEKKTPRKMESHAHEHVRPPRLGRAKTIDTAQAKKLAQYAPLIQDSARRNNVPVELICGVILQESGGKNRSVSRAGAKGLMQLMDETSKRFGVTDPFNPQQNIEGGTRYLRFLLDKFEGNVELALAGYNAGEQNVAKYGNKIPPFRETQHYVPSVLGYTQSMIDILAQAAPLPRHAKRV